MPSSVFHLPRHIKSKTNFLVNVDSSDSTQQIYENNNHQIEISTINPFSTEQVTFLSKVHKVGKILNEGVHSVTATIDWFNYIKEHWYVYVCYYEKKTDPLWNLSRCGICSETVKSSAAYEISAKK
jgi:hypothetical protein